MSYLKIHILTTPNVVLSFYIVYLLQIHRTGESSLKEQLSQLCSLTLFISSCLLSISKYAQILSRGKFNSCDPFSLKKISQ